MRPPIRSKNLTTPWSVRTKRSSRSTKTRSTTRRKIQPRIRGIDSRQPGVDPWLPGAGKSLVVPGRHILPPGPHEGIVVNLPEHRLYYYPKPKRGGPIEVITYPVSIGKWIGARRWASLTSSKKEKDPTWYPPESVRKEHAEAGDPLPAKVGPGPNNPLGAYAMPPRRRQWHVPDSRHEQSIAVGLAVTHGCIRMYPNDVAALFPLIPVGTPVRLINEPVKVAWIDGELFSKPTRLSMRKARASNPTSISFPNC